MNDMPENLTYCSPYKNYSAFTMIRSLLFRPSICLIGICFNFFNLYITHILYGRTKMIFYRLIFGIALCDLLYLITTMPYSLLYCASNFCPFSNASHRIHVHQIIYIILIFTTSNFFGCLSNFITVVSTYNRLRIVHSTIIFQFQKNNTHLFVALTVLWFVGLGLHIPNLFLLSYKPVLKSNESCYQPQRQTMTFSLIWGSISIVVSRMLPVMVMTIMNVILIRHISFRLKRIRPNSNRRLFTRRDKLTTAIVGTSLVFLFGQVPFSFFHPAYTKYIPHWETLLAVANSMENISYSINFLVYLICDSRFQHLFKEMFHIGNRSSHNSQNFNKMTLKCC